MSHLLRYRSTRTRTHQMTTLLLLLLVALLVWEPTIEHLQEYLPY